MSARKDIRIEFPIENRIYEAVGVLEMDEDFVWGTEMLERAAGENGGAIGDDEVGFIWRHRDKLPAAELSDYYLVTNKRSVGNPRNVLCFFYAEGRWQQGWSTLDDRWEWKAFALVLRRCA